MSEYVTQETTVKDNDARLYDWAMKVIENHARKIVAELEWKGEILYIKYPSHPNLEISEIAIHQPTVFARMLKAAEQSLEKQREKNDAGRTESRTGKA